MDQDPVEAVVGRYVHIVCGVWGVAGICSLQPTALHTAHWASHLIETPGNKVTENGSFEETNDEN